MKAALADGMGSNRAPVRRLGEFESKQWLSPATNQRGCTVTDAQRMIDNGFSQRLQDQSLVYFFFDVWNS